MRILALAATLWLMSFMVPAQAETPALPFVGKPGQLPIAVVGDYLAAELGHEGRFEYARLLIEQKSRPEAFDHVEMLVVRDGLLDDSVKAVRHKLTLSLGEDGLWRVDADTREQSCRCGRLAWNSKPCP